MPKIVDRDGVRRKLAQAACLVIAREGFQRATMSRIGRGAGYSATICQHYFDSRDELFLFAFAQAADRAEAELRERVGAAEGGAEKLAALVGALLEDGIAGADERALLILNLTILSQSKPAFRDAHEGVYAAYLDAIAEILAAIEVDGLELPLPPREEAALLLMMSDGVALGGLSASSRKTELVQALRAELGRRYGLSLGAS
jgi:AcrR family transcriptional regulator